MKKHVVQKHFELSTYENKVFMALCEKTGMKQSDVFRELILSNRLVEAPGDDFYKAIEEIRKIGVNINQIAHMANATGMVDAEAYKEDAERLENLVAEIRKQVYIPQQKRDISEIISEMEYMLWESEEKEMECRMLQEQLKKLIGIK